MLSKKIVHGVIPALLMSLSVGQIYAFTLFSTAVSESIGASQQAVQFAFSLGIFFLGMGAAFFGRIVENRIKVASVIGSALFLGGLCVSHYGVLQKSLWLLYLGYGFMLGLGTGTIYITPVKTLMMWFPRFKAIAAALPIIGFGLGSSLCTVLHNHLKTNTSVEEMFLYLAGYYLPAMVSGCLLLRKPNAEENAILCDNSHPELVKVDKLPYKEFLSTGYFWRCWTFMFLNISAGLGLIPLAKQLMVSVNYNAEWISGILIAMGLMNGAGRFIFAFASDFLKNRVNILLFIVGISAAVGLIGWVPVAIGLTLVVISACYGAGFSCIPAIVHDHYGMKNVSTIHGAVLSAWGFAGLVGNQLSLVAMEIAGIYGVLTLILLMHAANVWNIRALKEM